MPEQYNLAINRSILIVEKVVKLIEVVEFLKIEEMPFSTPLNLDSKERIGKIVNVLQDEVKSSKMDNMGMIMDLILNMDKYKKILNAYTSLSKNKNPLSDTNSIMDLMETFMGGSSDKDKEKIKEMTKMMELMKLLDTPKKDKPNEA